MIDAARGVVYPRTHGSSSPGELLGTRTSKQLGVWEGLSTTWSSGGATSVTLQLVNANTQPSGNDFAVDDIFLGTESSISPPK